MANELAPLSDEDLSRDDKHRNRRRKHRILDAVTTIAVASIYIIPTALGLLYLLVLIHEAIIGDWDALGSTIQGMIIPVITYLVGVLSNSGILPKNGD
jgi:hypothetical protein